MRAGIKHWLLPSGPRHRIDPLGFILGLILAPPIVTDMTFPVGGFSLFVLFFGGPIYLVAGTPLLL